MVSSLTVAEVFEKRHDAVLRDIKNLDCSADFNLHNFVEIKYKDSKGRKQPCYNMTKDGFVFLVMGFTGSKALEWKLKDDAGKTAEDGGNRLAENSADVNKMFIDGQYKDSYGRKQKRMERSDKNDSERR